MANEEVRHNAYLPGYNQVLHHELRTAENCAGYLIPVLKEKVALNPQLTLLDVGAGIGTITAGLAKYMPEGQVTAFDLSSEVLERAANYAKDAGVHNIQFKSGNVFELPFPDESFDIVHMHQMLCHLSTPIPALKEMLRVTKPDGVVAVRECDMRMWSWWPLLPGLDKFFKIQLATHEGAGGSNLAGPQLISWAMKAGAKRGHIKMSYGSWCYSEPRERAGWGTLSLFRKHLWMD